MPGGGLRHSCGVAAVTAGVPLPTSAAALGHAPLRTTAIRAEALKLVSRVWTSDRSRTRWHDSLHYVAAAHAAGQALLWVTAVWSACYVVLTIMTLLEIRKFSRWSDKRSREHRRRHAATIRKLARERAEPERRHGEIMRGLGSRIASMRVPR